MVAINELIRSLNRRREQLGMTLGALAERSGFSLPTVQRILAGDQPGVSLPGNAVGPEASVRRRGAARQGGSQEG